MILEGVVTTLNEDGGINISPMGPTVDERMETIMLRPFRSAVTYRNLKRTGEGVLHVTDDVELIARAAVSTVAPVPPLRPAQGVKGWILADACRWYAFRVESCDESQERARFEARVVDRGRIRDFFGFNRAKHAVVEAAIVATRVGILTAEQIRSELERLRVLVDKTGGDQERRAFEFLESYVGQALNLPQT